MAEGRNSFADALSRHDPQRLRAAFDACNEAGSTSYDRTTLGRWLDGSVPTRGEFIRCLADDLEDDDLYRQWEAVHGGRSSSASRSVVSRFESLPAEERARAFPDIRRHYLSRFGAVRSSFSMRIDLHDDRDDPDLFELRATLNWAGRVPAAAKVAFTTGHRRLNDAYGAPDFVFREVLEMESDRLDELLAAKHEQVMTLAKVSDQVGQTTTSHTARWEGDGMFTFDNEEREDAQIRLSLSYPYPRGVQVYPIRFGQYQVHGQVRITFASHSREVSRLRCMAFMPSGEGRDWSFDPLRPDELVVYLGERDTVLSDGNGAVLSWAED